MADPQITDPPSELYISITGLRVKRIWHYPRFFKHAGASMTQARSAVGCHSAEAKLIKGVQHTRSVWTSKTAMMDFIYSGAHMQAIRVFKKIATGKTFGYTSSEIPEWDDVHRLWKERGADY